MADIGERFGYACISAFFGAVLGVACWWLYGLAHSLSYDGPGLDPVLCHWVVWLAFCNALLGFSIGARAGDVFADLWSAVFHFEFEQTPGASARLVCSLAFLAIVIVAIWFSAPA